MKQREHFVFLQSYYKMFTHLKTKKDQALFINSILSAQFLCTKLEVLPEFSPSLQMALDAVSYQINSSIKGYTDKNGSLDSKGVDKPLPKKEKKKKNIPKGIEIEVEYKSGLNIGAYESWLKYKGNKYSKQGKTLSMNLLVKFDTIQQQQMVDSSIMNGYKGLFEPKQQNNTTEKSSTMKLVDRYYADKEEVINAELS